MSKSRLISGKVKKLVGSELDSDRSSFLNLANAEPDLGFPNIDGSILVADTDGTRYWSPSIRADVTGNIFLGSINSADGSTAIRLTNSTIIEGDLTIDSVGNIPTLITSDIRSLDSSSIVIANSIIAQSNLEVQNDLTVNGNFTVLGSTTTINSTTLTVEDKNIELAKNSTSAATSNGAGITVIGPATPATIAYDAATDTWNFNKTIVGTVQGATSIQDIDDRIDLFFDNDINTSDSSSIVFVPSVELRSDLTVDNDVRVTNSVYADRFVGDGSQLTNLPTFLGYTGSAGFTGSQGDLGYTGSQGDIGYTGSKGADGGMLTPSNYVVKAVKGGTEQTITGGSDQVVTFVDDFDPQNWFASNKFQPTLAGYYGIDVSIWWNAGSVSNNQTNIQLRKNGSTQVAISQALITTSVGNTQEINTIVYFNGTTDYVEVTAYTANPTSQAINGSSNGTWFTANLLAYGAQGDIGYTGSQGDVGFTGSAGAAGGDGSVGFTGSQGELGFTGSQGDIGFTGSAGAAGGDGSVGFTGSQGDIGYTGSAGAGFTGSRGDVGFTGSVGANGNRSVTLAQEGLLVVREGTARWYAPAALTISQITFRLDVAADQEATIVIKKNGVATRTLVMPVASLKTVNTTAFSMAEDDYLTVDVTTSGSAGSTTQGSGLNVVFLYSFTSI